MAKLDKLTATELKSFLSGQTKKLKLLKTFLIVTIAVVVLSVIGHVIYYYNYLTNLKFDVITAEAKVSSAMQYRANLIPLLIESVVGFVEHEDNVFNSVVDGRERSIQSSVLSSKQLNQMQESVKKIGKSGNLKAMGNIMEKIMAWAEQYPDLKTSVPFQLLMTKASDTEAEIYKQRLIMNDMINIYTTSITMFPGNFYSAVLFDFPDYPYFTGELYSEWPNFSGKKYSDWPKVSVQSSKEQ